MAQTSFITDHPALPDHPRILMLKGEEQSVIQTVSENKEWQKINQAILFRCDAWMSQPTVQHVLTGKRMLSQSRECLLCVFYLSYAWRMTHRE
jgi:hypothetical protein